MPIPELDLMLQNFKKTVDSHVKSPVSLHNNKDCGKGAGRPGKASQGRGSLS